MIGSARSTITEHGESHEFTRYFITSLDDLDECADSVRKHWSIENQLHWCLDVIFREDASRARKDNYPLNLNILRKTALNFVSQAQYKRISQKRLMFRAALEPTLFLDIFLKTASDNIFTIRVFCCIIKNSINFLTITEKIYENKNIS